jgi:hypothetical protein
VLKIVELCNNCFQKMGPWLINEWGKMVDYI